MAETSLATIRPYRAEDQHALLQLIRELQGFEKSLEPLMKPDAEIGLDYIEQLQTEIDKYGGNILIAEEDGRIAGYAAFFADVPSEDEDEIDYRYALVRDLAVTAAHRGKGLGTRLLNACERLARNADAQRLRITVLSRNTSARRLYTQFGFAERITEMEKPLE